ncbi:MAG: NUDIX hydrolase, partial [Alphaproteobacteria bacterium]
MAEDNASIGKKKHRSLRPVDAATMVLWRERRNGNVEVLMGRRHRNHVFMPHAWVFPGGRIDAVDKAYKPATSLRHDVQARLERAANPTRARAIAAGGVREVYEETGLLLGETDRDAPGGFRPRLDGVDYFFRAITPPGRSRRFDARFLVAEAEEIGGKLDGGDGELLDADFHALDCAPAPARPEPPRAPVTVFARALLHHAGVGTCKTPGGFRDPYLIALHRYDLCEGHSTEKCQVYRCGPVCWTSQDDLTLHSPLARGCSEQVQA